MQIAFIGAGYVGLVTGLMMAHIGHKVTCLDTDEAKINSLLQNKSPIYEDGIDEYLSKYSGNKQIEFSNNYTDLSEAEIIFLAVGTPSITSGKNKGGADLTYVHQAVKEAAKFAKEGAIFVLKSTVPPGSSEQVNNILQEIAPEKNFFVAANPEFLREGSAIKDFLEPDRIVIGANKQLVADKMAQLYAPLVKLLNRDVPILHTDLNTAEMIKYASNSFLANKIAFINEMADLCENIGADSDKLAIGVGLDHRIGKDFLKTGPGFGGSCFPKDILALQYLFQQNNEPCPILDSIISTNNKRPGRMISKIKSALGGSVKNKKITIFGVSYKAGTDDIRSSPAIEIIKLLHAEGAIVTCYDPQALANFAAQYPNISADSDAYAASKEAAAIVILTEWPEFTKLDYSQIYQNMADPILIDLRNILSSNEMDSIGFDYHRVGKNTN